jgi:hypothetical protein
MQNTISSKHTALLSVYKKSEYLSKTVVYPLRALDDGIISGALNGHTTYPWHLYDFLWGITMASCSIEMNVSCYKHHHQKSKQPFIWSVKVVLSDALSSISVTKGRANRILRLAFASFVFGDMGQRIHRRSTFWLSSDFATDWEREREVKMCFRHPWRPVDCFVQWRFRVYKR